MEIKEIKETKSKEDIIKILNANNVSYNITNCGNHERICISLSDKNICCDNSIITLQNCNKDICKVYSRDILYIAIENRKSVLYLTDRKIETNYNLDHWKNVLNEKIFAQPHYSYIVNLTYVVEVTKDFVKIRYDTDEHKVYTSLRKIGTFKKAVLEFGR